MGSGTVDSQPLKHLQGSAKETRNHEKMPATVSLRTLREEY